METATEEATLSEITDHNDGTYTATITSTIAGDVTIIAKISEVVIIDTATVLFKEI